MVSRTILIGALCAAGCLAGCDSAPPARNEARDTLHPPALSTKQVTYVPQDHWPRTERQVAELVANSDDRPLTDEEVAKLEFAANQGVLSAYYHLDWHHSTDGNPAHAEKWYLEGVKRGEPNLLVLHASRQMTRAEDMPMGEARDRLLRQAKLNFQAALKRKGMLRVARIATVQEDIAAVDRLLDGAASRR